MRWGEYNSYTHRPTHLSRTLQRQLPHNLVVLPVVLSLKNPLAQTIISLIRNEKPVNDNEQNKFTLVLYKFVIWEISIHYENCWQRQRANILFLYRISLVPTAKTCLVAIAIPSSISCLAYVICRKTWQNSLALNSCYMFIKDDNKGMDKILAPN